MARIPKLNSVTGIVCGALLLAAGAVAGGCATGANPHDKSAAVSHHKKADDAQDPSPEILYGLSRALLSQGKDQEGAAMLSRLITECPEFAPPYSDLAELLMRYGKPDAAKQTLTKGLRVAPHDPVLLNNLGICLLMETDYAQALDCFTKASTADSPNPRYRANQALALGMLGRYDEASVLYKEILPESAAAHNLSVIRNTREVREAAQQSQTVK